VTILLPPLRERDDDVILLANVFLNQYNAKLKKQVEGFTSKADEAMMRHSGPGNVRELQNRIRRGIVVARDNQLAEEEDIDLVPSIRKAQDTPTSEGRT
jgi:two-component system NtrC family response regulator